MDILAEVRNHVAFITLNRPAALNALTLPMSLELRKLLRGYAVDPAVYAVLIKGAGEKAFCAGGDIRALYDSYRVGGTLHIEFFAAEYPLDYLLRFYPKPYVALADGITMGGGMGLAQGAWLRLVGERTRIAMPEVAIGFFPDVGASYFLSRLPGALGPYLALTGAQLRAADAMYVGLADLYLSRLAVDALEQALMALSWSTQHSAHKEELDRCIRTLAASSPPPEPAEPPLAKFRSAIDRHFSAASVPALLSSLRGERQDGLQEWALQTAQLVEQRSPTMLAVAMEELARGRGMSYADCLRMEFGMARQTYRQGDFIEGVRALVIDKDNAPRWNPAHIDEVSAASVETIFESPWEPGAHPLRCLENELIISN